jgi:hypothetical protein
MDWLEERDMTTHQIPVSKWLPGMICISICCLLSVGVSASVPGLISYQGHLNDDGGTPVNGTVTMTFSLFDVPGGGTALWTENQNVNVSNGVFNVQLGSVQAIPSYLFNNDELFLGIIVGADAEMTPRQRLTSSPYSQRSEVIMPIGSIVAWNKGMPGTPALSDGWVECNGQVLADAESPYNGQTIPNLNGTNKVLKGDSASGTVTSENYLPPHSHQMWGCGDYAVDIGCAQNVNWMSGKISNSGSGTATGFFSHCLDHTCEIEDRRHVSHCCIVNVPKPLFQVLMQQMRNMIPIRRPAKVHFRRPSISGVAWLHRNLGTSRSPSFPSPEGACWCTCARP